MEVEVGGQKTRERERECMWCVCGMCVGEKE
jgi:hypothetical protein